MTAKVLLLLALLVASAAAGIRYREDPYGGSDAKYRLSYNVYDNKGNDFGHKEQRDGDFTDGRYFALLPDGTQQTVNYFIDGKSGFVADVSYEGEAQYDSGSHESYGPRYDSRSHGSYGPRYDSRSHGSYGPSYDSGSQESYGPGYDSRSQESYGPRSDSESYEFYRPIYGSGEFHRVTFRSGSGLLGKY